MCPAGLEFGAVDNNSIPCRGRLRPLEDAFSEAKTPPREVANCALERISPPLPPASAASEGWPADACRGLRALLKGKTGCRLRVREEKTGRRGRRRDLAGSIAVRMGEAMVVDAEGCLVAAGLAVWRAAEEQVKGEN